MSEWVDLLRRIQDGGKRVHIICESDEVELLSRSLDRSKLLLVVFARSQKEGESLLASSERTWGV